LINIPPNTIGTYRPEMSNKRRYVFRTTEEFARLHPLWIDESYPFPLECLVSEATRPFLQHQVRATAYVDGELIAECSKPIAELTNYFLPARCEKAGGSA
jgi:hypothetical protein